MYLALAILMLAAIACGSPEPVEPTPTPDVPLFAEGEAEALVGSVVFDRFGDARREGGGFATTFCKDDLKAAHRVFVLGTTTASYLGKGVWSVVSDPVKSGENQTVTFQWKVYEFSGVVQPTTLSAEHAMEC